MTRPPGAGRFAPSPSADLHIGNLRTAMLAWLFARSTGRRFLMRIDDLDDRTHADVARRQLDDLAAIGLTWDGPAEWQSEHPQRYDDVVDYLADHGLLYECYCSRRDIAQAPRAPHAPQGAYPGTCRDLSDAERESRRREMGRPPALRLRAEAIVHTVHDLLHGEYTGIVDDFVVRRGDGVPAYNLAVVVDDTRRASTRWCAETTCCRRRRGRPTSRGCWATRSRRTRTSRWCSTKTARGWPNATAP